MEPAGSGGRTRRPEVNSHRVDEDEDDEIEPGNGIRQSSPADRRALMNGGMDPPFLPRGMGPDFPLMPGLPHLHGSMHSNAAQRRSLTA